MKNKIERIFLYLDSNSINYLLLRPIDFEVKINDIDLFMPKASFKKLINVLKNDSKSTYLKYSNANESIQLYIDDILLDIKYNICFLARKSLIIDHNIPHSSVELRENRYIFPRIDNEVLFTFWTYHLILDKVEPSLSSTYKMHNNFYKISWKSLVKSNFFILWTNLIFKNNSNKAIKLIKLFFDDKMNYQNKFYNKKLQNLAILSNNLFLRFYFDKYYFKFLRFSGIINKRRTLYEIKC